MKIVVLAAFIGLVGLIEAVPGQILPGVIVGTIGEQKHRSPPPPEAIGTLIGGKKTRALGGGWLKRASRAVATSGSEKDATVLRSKLDVQPDAYNYEYETSNGINAQASGALKKTPEGEAITAQGQYSYLSPDGTPIELQYVADESGYHPTGAHIPTPPPVSSYIASSLEWIQAHPAPVDKIQ